MHDLMCWQLLTRAIVLINMGGQRTMTLHIKRQPSNVDKLDDTKLEGVSKAVGHDTIFVFENINFQCDKFHHINMCINA